MLLFKIILLFLFFTVDIFSQDYNSLLNIIKFATKDKKLAEIRNIAKLPKKDVELLFDEIVSQQDIELITEVIPIVQHILTPQKVLPSVVPILSKVQLQYEPVLQQKISTVFSNYVSYYKEDKYLIDFFKENILSETQSLQIRSFLINYINFLPYSIALSIINQIYNKQDVIRTAVALILSNFSDEQTKYILIEYLSDELPEVQLQAVKSLLIRKEWDVIPLILPKINNKFIGKEVKQLLLQINDVSASKYFFLSIPAFTDVEIKKICIIQSSKFCDVSYLPTFIELYIKEQNYEIKQLLRKTIENYKTKEAENILISYLENKNLQDIIIPLLININSTSALPYFIKIYPKVDFELKEKIKNFVTNVSDKELLFYILPYAKTKNIQLRCLIISSLSSFDTPSVYATIENEINLTKNKKMLETIILSLTKIKSYQYQIKFVKLLIKKCYKEHELLEKLLEQTQNIVKQPYKYTILFEDLVALLEHREQTIVEKSYSILQLVIKNSELAEIRIIYPLVLQVSDKTKKMLLNILVNYPDNEFLNYVEKIYYTTNDIELKKLCCSYVLNVTNDVSHKIIYDSINSKDYQLQLNVLNLSKDKIDYEDINIFLPLCMSKNSKVRQTAVITLQHLFTEREKIYIVEFLKDNNVEIKLVGIKLMAKILPQEFLSFVPKLLLSKNELVRKTTLEMLMENKYARQNNDIKKLVFFIAKKDNSIDARSTAIKTLSYTWGDCSTEAIKLYFDAISSYEAKLQHAAKFAFDNILPIAANSEEIFVKGVVNESISINKYFIQKIIELKPQSQKLKQTLTNKILYTPNDEMRKLLLSSLAEILSQEDFYLIKDLYTNGNIIVKLWCLEQINKFPLSKELETLLLNALKETQTVIRQKAVEASSQFLASKKIYDAILYISQNDTNYTIRSIATKILNIKR